MSYRDSICRKCGEGMTIRDGCDPTDFCDDCAQTIAKAAKAFVIAHRQKYDREKVSGSAKVGSTFMGLCDAVLPLRNNDDSGED